MRYILETEKNQSNYYQFTLLTVGKKLQLMVYPAKTRLSRVSKEFLQRENTLQLKETRLFEFS